MSTAVAVAATGRGTQRDSVANLGVFTAFASRRNWTRFLVWFLVVVGMLAFIISYYQTFFKGWDVAGSSAAKALLDFIAVAQGPSTASMVGVISNPGSIGGAVWCKYWMMGSLMLGIGVMFLMTRNLRGDEDQGRTELVRSTPLGIHSPMASSVILMSALCVVIGVVSGLLASVSNLTSASGSAGHWMLSADGTVVAISAGNAASGAWILGLSMGAIGLLGVGIGALANEICPSSTASNMTGIAVFAVLYIIRMMGDLQPAKLGNALWISPIGWGEKMDPWGANRWWPLLLIVVLTAILVAIAWLMASRRDLGASLARESRGTDHASGYLKTVWGMGIRLQRGSLIGWVVGLVIFTFFVGSVISVLQNLFSQANIPGAVAGSSLDQVAAFLIALLSLAVSVFAAQSATSLRTDEATGVLESQLAGGVSRISWALQRLAVTFVVLVGLLVVCGLCFGASYAAAQSDPSKIGLSIAGFLVYLPACLLMAAVFVIGFGWWPRVSVTVTWIVVGIMWVIMIIGVATKLPAGLVNAMPFNATPKIPGSPMDWTPVIIMTVIAAVLIVAGLIGFRRRNIPA